ncbi:type IV toxin-antitoxin system AbiEi family antitoxin [Geopseudomonas aromaticivorans]
MAIKDFYNLREKLSRKGVWAMHSSSLMVGTGCGRESLATSLSRACQDGVVERLTSGFYRFPGIKLPLFHLEQLASWLRPNDFFYLSLESVLSDAGWISQVPNRLTFMTTGRSYTYKTSVGIIEFVHTKVPFDEWRTKAPYDPVRRIRVATAEKALEDLTNVGRNLDLVREESDRH